MRVFRICKSEFANDISGKGAGQWGGRWNNKGVALLYSGESKAVCIAEMSVKVNLALLPEDYKMVTIEIPVDAEILEIENKELPGEWDSYPINNATQKLGDSFIKENKFLVMKVPSAIAQPGCNYLINPGHKDFLKVKIVSVEPLLPD